MPLTDGGEHWQSSIFVGELPRRDIGLTMIAAPRPAARRRANGRVAVAWGSRGDIVGSGARTLLREPGADSQRRRAASALRSAVRRGGVQRRAAGESRGVTRRERVPGSRRGSQRTAGRIAAQATAARIVRKQLPSSAEVDLSTDASPRSALDCSADRERGREEVAENSAGGPAHHRRSAAPIATPRHGVLVARAPDGAGSPVTGARHSTDYEQRTRSRREARRGLTASSPRGESPDCDLRNAGFHSAAPAVC